MSYAWLTSMIARRCDSINCCGRTRARVTIDQLRRVALQTFYGHMCARPVLAAARPRVARGSAPRAQESAWCSDVAVFSTTTRPLYSLLKMSRFVLRRSRRAAKIYHWCWVVLILWLPVDSGLGRSVALYCCSSTLYRNSYHNYSVSLFLKRQCDRTLGRLRHGLVPPAGGSDALHCLMCRPSTGNHPARTRSGLAML